MFFVFDFYFLGGEIGQGKKMRVELSHFCEKNEELSCLTSKMIKLDLIVMKQFIPTFVTYLNTQSQKVTISLTFCNKKKCFSQNYKMDISRFVVKAFNHYAS